MKTPAHLGRMRFSVVPLLIVFPLSVLVVFAGMGCNPKEPPYPEVGIATQANTDAYNYYNYRDGVADFIYNQLWYFNFLDDRGTPDSSDDLAGVAAYGLANPENLLTGGGVANSFGMIIRDPAEGDSFPVYSEQWDPSVPGNFSASTTFLPGASFFRIPYAGTTSALLHPVRSSAFTSMAFATIRTLGFRARAVTTT